MLIRLLYASRATGPQTTTVTASILQTAQQHNAAQGISGVLCQGQDMYLQVLEGERAEVNRLYARIVADTRHQDVQLLLVQDITRRQFGQWGMAHVNLSSRDPMVALGHPEFDPYAVPGERALELLLQLVADGRPITQVPG